MKGKGGPNRTLSDDEEWKGERERGKGTLMKGKGSPNRTLTDDEERKGETKGEGKGKAEG